MWKKILQGYSVRWEKHRNQSADTTNARKDSKKDTKSKDAAQAQKVVQLQPRSYRQSPLEMHAAAQAKVQRLQAALATRVGTDQFYERIHRAGEETVGCRKGGSHRGCPESRWVHQSFGTGREAPRRIAVAGEEFCRTCPRRRGRVGSASSASGRELRGSAKVVERRTQQRVCLVLDMPGLIPGELSPWMENRQADVQEALIQGEHRRVIELSSMLTKIAERMVEMTRLDILGRRIQVACSPRSRAAPRPMLTEHQE